LNSETRVVQGKGLTVAISSPSGGGKTTIIRKILAEKDKPYVYSVSVTTRPRRLGEVEGRDYHFVNEERFKNKIASGELIEHELVHDHFYGTPKTPLQKWVSMGCIVLMDMDVYGALSVRKFFPKQSLLIFLMPPDLATLKERLMKRNTDKPEEVELRMKRVDIELSLADQFDYIVINDRIEQTVTEIRQLIDARLQSLD
jgi:guanylate kinase